MSELAKLLTYDRFCEAFEHFIKQADENVITKRSNGSKVPFGLSADNQVRKGRSGKLIVDGGDLGQQFGQGAASLTPYFNWHVLSIYYIPAQQRIVLGIETERYASLGKLQPDKSEKISRKKMNVAVFGEYKRVQIDYKKLYKDFIDLSERIMKIGLD